MEAVNEYGTVKSQAVIFETAPAGGQPTIQQASVNSVTTNAITFSIIVTPDQQTTQAGAICTIGSTVLSSPIYSVPSGDSSETITWTATGLPPATTVTWQAFASNLWGIVTSTPQIVETMPLSPTVLSVLVTNVTPSGVQILAVVNPQGASAGFEVLVTNILTGVVSNAPFVNIGNASSPASFTAQLTGLSPGTPYSGLLVATNSGGGNSAGFEFTTLPLTPPTLAITAPSNGVATLTVGNAASETYVVQMSTDLLTWTDWQTNTGFGYFPICITNGPSCFYRTSLLLQ
jgi:hypothetical protein